MKHFTTLKMWLIAAALMLVGGVVAETTVTYQFNATDGIQGDIDDNISFEVKKNDANDPAVYSDQIRLYSVRASGNGNTIIFTPSAGAVITSVTLHKASDNGKSSSVMCSVDGADPVEIVETYSISDIAAYESVAIQNAHQGGDKNEQMRLTSVTITYSLDENVVVLTKPEVLPATDITEESFTANWNDVEHAEFYKLTVYTKDISNVGPELIVNGDFEADNLDAWSFKASADNGVLSTEEVHSGSQSLKVTVNATENITQKISVEAGKSYVLSLWYYLDLDEESTANGFRVWTTKGADIKLPSASDYFKEDKKSWEYVEHTFEASLAEVEFELRVYKGTTVYFDDISIKEIAGNVSIKEIEGSPFSVNATTKEVTGLAANTEYFYTVQAFKDPQKSEISDEMSVKTLEASGVQSPFEAHKVWVQDGKLVVNTDAVELVKVFDITGKKVAERTVAAGLNQITLRAHGVYIVQVGDYIQKVIL